MITESLGSVLDRLDEEPRRRVESWDSRTVRGFDIDLRSQIFHSESRESVVDRWSHILQVDDLDPLLAQFETSEKDKIGPYSLQDPWVERRKFAEEFMNERVVDIQSDSFSRAVERLRSLLPARSVKTISLKESMDRIPRGTSSGLPWMTRDRGYLSWYLQHAQKGDVGLFPFVAGWRGQPGGRENGEWVVKQRLVWISQRIEAICGGTFAHPLTEALKSLNQFAAYLNPEAVGARVSIIIRESRGRLLQSADFDSFDQSMPAEMIDAVSDVILSWLSDKAFFWDRYWEFVKEGGILTPDGVMSGRSGGIPSGVVTTSVLGSLCNLLSALYVSEVSGSKLVNGVYLGDDSVNDYDPALSSHEISEIVSGLNLTMNEDKQFTSVGAVHFLQNLYAEQAEGLFVDKGVRPTFRALNGILSYERPRSASEWTPWLASMRTIMQLENCKNHPKFHEFVKFVSEGDERLLSHDASEIATKAGGVHEVERKLNITSFRYTSQNVSSLSSFATVQVLRELRG